ILIVSFFLLGGFLLFYNLSSYLMQTRLRELADDVHAIAQSTALEIQRAGGRDIAGIVSRRQAVSGQRFPGIVFAVVPDGQPCAATATPAATSGAAFDLQDVRVSQTIAAGPWDHVDAPRTIPKWLPCAGLATLTAYSHPLTSDPAGEAHLVVRGAALP